MLSWLLALNDALTHGSTQVYFAGGAGDRSKSRTEPTFVSMFRRAVLAVHRDRCGWKSSEALLRIHLNQHANNMDTYEKLAVVAHTLTCWTPNFRNRGSWPRKSALLNDHQSVPMVPCSYTVPAGGGSTLCAKVIDRCDRFHPPCCNELLQPQNW